MLRVIACAALAASAIWPAPAAGQDLTPTAFRQTGRLVPSGITESSGVAVSRRHAGVLWTHNDSGDGPFIYAVDSTGARLATFRVTGARAIDWEDIAFGPCPGIWAGSCLYVGDIGDNAERRGSVALYVFPEPDPAPGRVPSDSAQATAPALALRVKYLDGAHDAEALLVTPDTTAWIITKGRSGPILRYRLQRAQLLADSIATVPFDTLSAIVPMRMLGRWVTGAAISPDATRIAVRTYTEVYFFRRGVSGSWSADGPPCWLGPREAQGEGIDFLDDSTEVLTSESGGGGDGSISMLRCPRPGKSGLAPTPQKR